MELLTPKFDVQVATNKLLSNWNALFPNRIYLNYLCSIYKRFKEKNVISFREIVREGFVHLVSDSIFKRLKFDCSSSETVSNQKIKIHDYLLDNCVFLEIRLTHEYQVLPNITRNK